MINIRQRERNHENARTEDIWLRNRPMRTDGFGSCWLRLHFFEEAHFSSMTTSRVLIVGVRRLRDHTSYFWGRVRMRSLVRR